ncbi:MAG TPA: 5-oxoprolinase subunit PxpB [Pyrinomonadaceae bacterium]|nr:5-oxoprolinase subunit PxpB [Pyrinomonadaceae bacterium]
MNDADFFPLGEGALTVNFGSEISPEINNRVIQLEKFFEKNSFPGFIESLPAYASLTIFYDLYQVRKNFREFSTAFDAVKHFASGALKNLGETETNEPRLIEIPVNFSAEHALDLEFVAESRQLPKAEVIKIFTAQTYRVYMLGFLPGFAYMGEVDERIAAPRKENPRVKIPKGSVGIAGRQTGIYPSESPGGWQIIGWTELELFTPKAENPTFLQAGDLIKFYPVE